MKKLSTTVVALLLMLSVSTGMPTAVAQEDEGPDLCETMLDNYHTVCAAAIAASRALNDDSTDAERAHAAALNDACSNASRDYNNVCVLFPAQT